MSGVKLSRSIVKKFDHNNMAQLEERLQEVKRVDKKKDLSLRQRRFIICEGLYRNQGDICPLPEVVALAKKCVAFVMH